MRILLVEDDADHLRWLRGNLGNLGHETICCMDGDTAFASWQIQRPFDFVVTSQLFHGRKIKTGLELIVAIRAVDPLQAFVMETLDENLAPPFAVPVLVKPFPFRRLLRLLEPSAQASLPLGY